MQDPHIRYMCFPSVVCVGKETEVWIKPRDISRIFREEWEYQLGIVGLLDDQLSYHDPVPLDHSFTIRNGCLVFRHTFDCEQEYSIRFCKAGEKEIRISLYAVQPDLYTLRPLKGDLHTHSYCSDGVDGVAMTPADYREAGFDFFALTDHNRMFPSLLAAQLYENVKLGMLIMPGEEVHTPGSLVHIVHAGGKESVCEQYIRDPEGYESAIDAVEKTLPEVDPRYRRRVAMAAWACRRIHDAGGIAIFPHPFWCPNRYNLSGDLLNYIYDNRMFDAFELMGGIHDRENNLQLAYWQEQSLRGNHLSPVGSSDSHKHLPTEYFNRRFTVVFAKENTTEAILDAVKSGYTVAADVPSAETMDARFYGSLRLVMFAQFLYENYFCETQRLCMGEGILMRRYAEGEDVGQMLSALADTVENFYKKFYGITAPEGIPTARQTYLDQVRATQCSGPVTRGSLLNLNGRNARNE